MAQRKIGIRELKASLSACLKCVKAGETIVITERGKPVGRMLPIETSLKDKLHEGVRARLWTWNGRKWQPASPKLKTRGKALVSDLLLEDRE